MPHPASEVPDRTNRPVMAGGDQWAAVYADLRRMAHARMRLESGGHTLSATALVHEVWIRLLASDLARTRDPEQWRNAYLGMASRVMRQVLVDHARSRGRRKRGGDVARVPLTDALAEAEATAPDRGDEILAVHEALELLARIDPFQAEVAELRLFGGLTLEQVALVTEKPLRQVRARWQLARAWLGRRVRRAESSPGSLPAAVRERATGEGR